MEDADEPTTLDDHPSGNDVVVARRVTLADVMILIAMTALGLLILRMYQALRPPPHPTFPLPIVWGSCLWASPFLLPYACGLLAVRFRPLRSSAHLIFRQPGAVACIAILVHVLANWLFLAGRTFSGRIRFGIDVYLGEAVGSGEAIALAWITLRLARAWRPESDWVDRSGRILGTLMIAVWVLTSLNL